MHFILRQINLGYKKRFDLLEKNDKTKRVLVAKESLSFIHPKLKLYDNKKKKVAYILLNSHHDIYINQQFIACIEKNKEFGSLSIIEELGWSIVGDVRGFQFNIMNQHAECIVEVRQKRNVWGNRCEVRLHDDSQLIPCTTIILALAYIVGDF